MLTGVSSRIRVTSEICLQKKEVYYPLVEQLIKESTGATRVQIFDNTVRKGTIKYVRHSARILFARVF